MKNKTILMAAVLAVATVLAAGLTVLPSTVQEAQANPCSNNANAEDEVSNDGSGDATGEATGGSVDTSEGQECELIGNFEGAFDE